MQQKFISFKTERVDRRQFNALAESAVYPGKVVLVQADARLERDRQLKNLSLMVKLGRAHRNGAGENYPTSWRMKPLIGH
jgi:hypothetical protein